MAKKNTKSRYWVDDNSILPEIVITPHGNYPVLDEAGNPARTVGAIQDINPNAHIYERMNTQPFMDDYIEGETNAAANQRADALDAQVVPHMGDFVSAATKPLDALMPSRWVGLLDKDYNGLSVGDRLTRLFDENNRGLFINDNPYGLFSKQYAEEHPYWAMAGNTAFDVASTPFIWNGANKAYNIGKTAYNTGRNAVRDYNFARALDADIANTKFNVEEPLFTRQNGPIYNGTILEKPVEKKLGVTSSDTKGAPLSYKGQGNDIFTNYLYSGYISGKEIPFMNQNITVGLPQEAKSYLLHDTVDRNIREFTREGYDEFMNQAYRNKAAKVMDNVRVGRYTQKDYDKAGMSDAGGFYSNDNNFISVNTESKFPRYFVEKHEGRHLIDYETDLLDSQRNKLNAAYDDDFINLPNTEYAGSLEGYKSMDKERVTTNRDAREVLLGKNAMLNLDLADKIIDKMPDVRIFDAVEKANGYGRRYIQFLRDNNKLTAEKAQQFREAMKHVGMYAVPATIAATAYGASQQDNNVRAYGGLLDMANKFKDGGSKDDYNTWKKKIGDYKGIIVDGDDTYDYYNFFKDNPQMAWDMLSDNPEAHFIDKYKTPNHPTYSDESIYSRTPYIQGGTWNDYSPTVIGQKWNYALSPSQVNSNWDVERTINYLANAENEGAYVTDSNGRYPIVGGTVLGGTLTPVTITPNSHSQGGSLKSASWNDLSMREKADIIKVGVKHGLNRLADIKSKYNELAEGDSLEDINLYSKGGKKNRGNQAITISPNVYKAMKFFMDRGMPRVGAAGLVGGFMRESSGNLSPNALNPSSKAIGIAQWLGPRKRELVRRYGSNPTLEQQLEFVWHELNTNYKRALRELMAAKTPTQAADAALGWYEFSVGPMGAVKAFNDTGQDGWGALHKGRRFTHAILGAPYQMPQGNSVQEIQQPMYPQQQYNQPVVMPQNPYPMPMPTVDYQKLAMQQMEMLQRDQEERARQATYLAEKEQREAERNRRMGMLNLVMSMGAPEESNDNFFNSMLGLAMSNNAKKEETDYSSFNPFSLTV